MTETNVCALCGTVNERAEEIALESDRPTHREHYRVWVLDGEGKLICPVHPMPWDTADPIVTERPPVIVHAPEPPPPARRPCEFLAEGFAIECGVESTRAYRWPWEQGGHLVCDGHWAHVESLARQLNRKPEVVILPPLEEQESILE